MAKPKYFDGVIQVDHYGRISEGYTVRRMDIGPEQIDGPYFLINDYDNYDPIAKAYKKKRSPFTLSDLKVGPPSVSHPSYTASVASHFEIPNLPFDDELVYKGFYNGQYSTAMEFTSNISGRVFRVFMKDFDTYVPRMVGGIVKGSFIFRKRAAKFGLVLLK